MNWSLFGGKKRNFCGAKLSKKGKITLLLHPVMSLINTDFVVVSIYFVLFGFGLVFQDRISL